MSRSSASFSRRTGIASKTSMITEWRTSASSSRMLSTYEISDDLSRRQIQVLERRYGGRLRAHAAATRIQRAFRQYRMMQQWRRLVVPLQPWDTSITHIRYIESVTRWRASNVNGVSHPHRICDASRYANASEPSLQQQHWARRACAFSTSTLSSATGNQSNGSPIPTRYHPSVSLSAQLRATRSKECQSPPSPARLEPEPNAHRPYMELMSPRLSHRRIVADPPQMQASNVWVPRSSLSSARSCHTNSLPRLDTHAMHSTPLSSDVARQQAISEQQRRRQYRIALNFFNKKPARGIQFLLNWGFVEENAHAVAKLLIGRRGLSKQMIGEYLGHLHDPFHSSVLDHFINEIDLHGMEIDVALRHTLTFFRLPGEAQKIERIVQVFARRYIECNPERAASFHGADTVFVLAFAIIMLNTDLHSPNIKPSRKMKLEDFIRNLRGIDAGFNIDRSLLTGIYERIREHEFRSGSDHVTQVMKVDQSIVGKDKPKLVEPQRRLVCYCRLNQIMDRTKRQAPNAHQREVFLFNDMMLVAKIVSKKKTCSQYTLRMWTPLIGMRVRVFETNFYHFGVSIVCQDDQEILLNAKNDEDRHRFVADVRESIAECAEMEAIRIESELDKHAAGGLSRSESQRDSGLPDYDGAPLGNDVSNGSGLSNGGSERSRGIILQTPRRLSFNSLDSGVVEEGAACEFVPS
uniref:IQ motif and SEC7 domain-containing protein 1 n=1 Tax=Ascaris suum TaxID=6253 RepID=F1KWS2_ASCSU